LAALTATGLSGRRAPETGAATRVLEATAALLPLLPAFDSGVLLVLVLVLLVLLLYVAALPFAVFAALTTSTRINDGSA